MKPVPPLCQNLALVLASAAAFQTACRLQERFRLNGMYHKGDIVFGGLFGVHLLTVFPELSFRSEPLQPKCERFDFRGFQAAQTMVFAIEEINKNPDLLPNITLGYHLYDNCLKLGVAFRAATALVSGTEESFSDLGCRGSPPVLGIVGDPGSTRSIAISSVLSLFHVPMDSFQEKEEFLPERSQNQLKDFSFFMPSRVSYSATCSCLSDRQQYPSFFRTIPSDTFQVRAMMQILERFNWKWVGLLFSNDDYGVHAAQSFHQEISHFGCVAFSEMLPYNNDQAEIQRIVDIIRRSMARVVVAFSGAAFILPLTEEVARQNLTGRQWIASEAWSTAAVFHTKQLLPFLGGTLGIAIHRGDISGLLDFLFSLRPDFNPGNSLRNLFWEEMFNCRFKADSLSSVCTGQESLEGTESAYSDVSALRLSYNVYKAVYALAHALHDLLSCKPGTGPFPGSSCAELRTLQPWQLVPYLQRVNFTTSLHDQVSFDENGDALAIYDIMNWQKAADGTIRGVTVGVFDESAPPGQKLLLEEENIFWNFESNEPPRSICSEPCPPGTRKAIRKGQPVCCFDCLPCADGEISNQTDSSECYRCPLEFWSNQVQDHCVPKEIEFLSFQEPLGISLTTISLFGACICAFTLSVFARYRNTPVVKANNSELSFLLLMALTLCFLCSLLFIGQPQQWTCQLRHAAFGISFALSISCILVKTIVVVVAFKAKQPGGNSMKWFGVQQQRGTVLAFTVIQAVICVAWLTTASPVPYKNTHSLNSKIIFQCAVGSIAGFSALLGYIGLLAAISFLLAFLARNLPDSFNEAKFITFSMLIFCAVWIAFIPAYVSSPGKYSDAVEIFAILASSFGLLGAIFAPKCYIILLNPEKNTKGALMRRDDPKK